MKTIEITSCYGREWCPAEYDGHCMVGDDVDSVHNGIPYNCPLKESPILLQLSEKAYSNFQAEWRARKNDVGVEDYASKDKKS